MHTYEMLLMVAPSLEGEAMDAPVKVVEQMIEQAGGILLRVDTMGRKKLASPINKTKEAMMAVIGFKMGPEQVAPLTKNLHHKDEILRVTIIRDEAMDPQKPFTLTPVTGKEPKEFRRGGAGRRDPRRGPNTMRNDQLAPGERGEFQPREPREGGYQPREPRGDSHSREGYQPREPRGGVAQEADA